ncbi:hypothetical protein TNCV_1278941 [Trichonephila clavipes]|nr:hypothetical protein TNCV_1278941 [Trichonephila clavipes]
MSVDIYYACAIVLIMALISFIKWYLTRNDDYWTKKGIPSTPRESYFTFIYKLSTQFSNLTHNITERHSCPSVGVRVFWIRIPVSGRADFHDFRPGSSTTVVYWNVIRDPSDSYGPGALFMDDDARIHRTHVAE